MNCPVEDLFKLHGKVAVVTGGGGLLGRQFAGVLVEAGAHVFLLDVNAERLAIGGEWFSCERRENLVPVCCDITNESEVRETIHALVRDANIDILVNSAAIDPKFEPDGTGKCENNGAFSTYSLENWKRSLDVNLTGAFLVTREVCARMERYGTGSIVNVSSTYGLTGPDQRIYLKPDGSRKFFKPVDYSVTKSGLLGFTRALAAYYMNTNIRVNALTPGGAFNNHDPDFVASYSARTILGRMARPDEYRGAILFLCSEASSYMTGSNLVVDGGWTAL